MRQPPQIRLLPDGRRLHLQDGPIDLVVQAEGLAEAVDCAYRTAARRFATILDELCAELPLLRSPARLDRPAPQGIVARRMARAVEPFAAEMFITPMAAVAGAVAEEILGAMTSAAPLHRAFVNNGGDIALHLAPERDWTIGMIDRPDRPSLFGRIAIAADDPVRGLATSGWRGRSFSLGIADSVTVLARSAAAADAAATVIANAVDLPGHPAIQREPASAIQADSDLGERLVTRNVGALSAAEIGRALASGVARAELLLDRGLILGAALQVQGTTQIAGTTLQTRLDAGAWPGLSRSSTSFSLQEGPSKWDSRVPAKLSTRGWRGQVLSDLPIALCAHPSSREAWGGWHPKDDGWGRLGQGPVSPDHHGGGATLLHRSGHARSPHPSRVPRATLPVPGRNEAPEMWACDRVKPGHDET